MIDHIALNLYNNQVRKLNKQESRFQKRRKKGNVGVELTLIEVIYITCGKFYQVLNIKNVGAAVMHYFLFFKGKVTIHQRQFWYLTLDILLDNKNNFLAKMIEDTGNALYLLRFEEILGVIEKYHPISGFLLEWISSIPPTLKYLSSDAIEQYQACEMLYWAWNFEKFRFYV